MLVDVDDGVIVDAERVLAALLLLRRLLLLLELGGLDIAEIDNAAVVVVVVVDAVVDEIVAGLDFANTDFGLDHLGAVELPAAGGLAAVAPDIALDVAAGALAASERDSGDSGLGTRLVGTSPVVDCVLVGGWDSGIGVVGAASVLAVAVVVVGKL